MNQDEADRRAEEAELPLPYIEGGTTEAFTSEHDLFTAGQVREAIAAALVKLTQGQEPSGYISKTGHGTYYRETITPDLAALDHGGNKIWNTLYTHPAPSQQEERKPLTEGTAAAYLRDLVEALDGAFISSWQSTAKWQVQLDAARNYLKEQPK